MLTPVAGHVSLEMSTAARPGCHWGTPTVPFLEMMATAIVDDPLFDEDGGVVRFRRAGPGLTRNQRWP